MINELLSKTGLEIIKERIALIIGNELTSQKAKAIALGTDPFYATALETFWNSEGVLNIFMSRFSPFGESELNAIVISPSRRSFENGTSIKKKVTDSIAVNLIGYVPADADESGDSLTNRTLERVAGAITRILQSQLYKTLDFDPGFISHYQVTDVSFYDPNSQDAQNLNSVQITIIVEYDENAVNNLPVTLLGNFTELDGRFTIGEKEE